MVSHFFQLLGFDSSIAAGGAFFIAFVIAVIFHEVAHGVVALQLGDPTAKLAGRLTLNPIPHIDLWGTIIVPFLLYILPGGFIFGWAKPVPVNPFNVRGRYGMVLVALAGPATNLILLTIFGLAARLAPVATQLPAFFLVIALVNGLLMFFNLIPIPPLDGSKVLYLFLENRPDIRNFLERYSLFILLAILLFLPGVITQFAFVPALQLTSYMSGFSVFDIIELLQ